MWVTVEPGNVCEGRFEAAQLDAAHTVWHWQAGDSMSGGAQHSGITMTHDEAWREAMAAVERTKGAEALDAARAEGEAAGRAAERAAVVAMLLQSPDPVWGEVARCILDGEHLAPAPGGTP